MSRAANRVAFLSPDEFDALPNETQQALLAAQCEVKRGQVYRWSEVESFVAGCLEAAETRAVRIEGEKYLVLDTKIWRMMAEDRQQSWLRYYIGADNPAVCLSSTLADTDWVAMRNASIRALAGTFPTKSGGNCFSTTLAAVTQPLNTAMTIADFWLHQEPFLDGLERRGYHRLDETVALDAHDRVLIWNDQQGNPQHACYLIGSGLTLNKNSQAWYAPRQILHLDTVLKEWNNDTFEIAVYGRA